MLLGLLIGWMIKPKLYNDEPWKKNLPTAEFHHQKMNVIFPGKKQFCEQVYSAGPGAVGKFRIPCLVVLPGTVEARVCTSISITTSNNSLLNQILHKAG